MTTTMMMWPVPVIDRTGEPVPSPVDEPIFQDLARCWAAAGRLVPGQDDREWTQLVGYGQLPVG